MLAANPHAGGRRASPWHPLDPFSFPSPLRDPCRWVCSIRAARFSRSSFRDPADWPTRFREARLPRQLSRQSRLEPTRGGLQMFCTDSVEVLFRSGRVCLGGRASRQIAVREPGHVGQGRVPQATRTIGSLLAPLLNLGLVLLLTAICARPSAAQFERNEYPPRTYDFSFVPFHDGEFGDALRAFNSAARDGIRTPQGRWVDSICYFAMTGECYYHMGRLDEALERYTSALNLFLDQQHWMLRVEFPPMIEQTVRVRRPITWGPSNRGTRAGRFPNRVQILQGRFDNDRVIQQGGVISLPKFIRINAHEIVRCTALAIRRRREIMGRACQHDALTNQVYQALSVRPTRADHWSEAWISVQLGMAAAAAGKQAQAVSELKRSLSIGQLDHPLTAMALFELGKLSFENEQFSEAASYFLEASISAAWYGRYDLVAESLRWGAVTHMVRKQPGVYPPLQRAVVWANRDSRLVQASVLIAAAENSAVLDESTAALGLIERARRQMVRTDLLKSAVGARAQYVAALAHYQNGNLKAGDQAFLALMKYQRQSSFRLFEIGLVDQLYTSGAVSERVSNRLFAEVLREPSSRDWVLDPVETLSVALTPHPTPLEHWFEAALRRKEYERAIEITDRIRRHRFFSSLPMGGRLLSLRWVLEGPKEVTSDRAVLQRQELLASFPKYAQYTRQAAALRKQLGDAPLLPDDDAARRVQARVLAQLAKVSTSQEVLLRAIALRRAPADFVFPPPLDFKKVQSELPKGRLVLSYLSTASGVFAFVFGNETDSYPTPWRIEDPATVRRGTAGLLRAMGHIEKNQPVSVEQLRDERWKTISSQLLNQLTNNVKPGVWDSFDELIIVPDGPLWYVPFEALQVRNGPTTSPLISLIRVRYVPTVSLALPDKRRASPSGETAVVAGQLFPRGDTSAATATLDELSRHMPRVTQLTDPLPGPANVVTTLCDCLVVLADLDGKARGPYDWSPMPLNRGKRGSSLGSWMSLPWGGPQQIVLPGFHTAAENALKSGGTGNEVFLAVCGMMATGARTMLLSRWRTGGQTSFDLAREFVQELPHTSAADAWQRSVQLIMDGEVAVEREPRVKQDRTDETRLKADHPFFWAGYLVVDTGAASKAADSVSDTDVSETEP